MAGVVLNEVSKRYGDVVAVDGLSLAVADGEFMVLVGPSGCGKSTALRMIAGLEEISAGTVSIGGHIVNDLPPKDRDVAMVFQNYALYPHMTVRENLEFGPRVRKLPRAEIDRLVGESARILGIEPVLDRKPRQLSGGQRQRVALGRALVRKPRVFLFDEPLSNLDARLRLQMRAEISSLQKRLGTTAIYVTHDQLEAMTMGSRIAVLKDGRLQQVGTPLEVYERPSNTFVATFLGSPPMSLVKAAVAENGSRVEAGTFALPVPDGLRSRMSGRDGLSVLVGIRPEHLHAAGFRAKGPVAPVRGTVEHVEALGHEAIVHFRTGEDLLVARLDPRSVPPRGQSIGLSCEVESLHLFEAETGRRLSA